MNFGLWAGTSRHSYLDRMATAVIAGAIGLGALPMLAQGPLKPPSSGLINPRAIVFNPANGKVYAVDTGHGAVQIYSDGSRKAHPVAVGDGPVSIAVNPSSGRVYVANAGSGTLSVLDGNSDAVVATVPVGSHPYSVAVNAATGKVYVTHTFGDQLSIVDGASNKASEFQTGSSDLIAIDSRKGVVYLLGYGGAVKVLEEVSMKMNERLVGKHAWGLMLNDVTGAVYVARIEGEDLATLEPGSTNATSLPAGEIPCAIAVNAKANKLYVANYGDNSVSVIDSSTGRKSATVIVGRHPKAIAFDASRGVVYVANTSDGTITEIDARNDAVLATVGAGKNPYALAVVPGSSRLYVANEADDSPSTVVDVSGISGVKQ